MYSKACLPSLHSVRLRLLSALSPLGLIAGLSIVAAPALAQTAPVAQAQQTAQSEPLKQIEVTAPRRKPKRRSTAGAQPAPLPSPQPVPEPSASERRGANTTPLNTNVIAESASRLGLTPRETPATVEVIDQQTMKDRGQRTVTEAIQSAVGVTAGDSPAAPSAFSMRGFTEDQITTLYNGIKVGPGTMTNRPMDVGNLEQIEILKGPASLLSGEGATGGAVNYVTKRPHTGKIENELFTTWDSITGFRGGFGSGGSTAIKGLDYRFDVTGSQGLSFIDDTYSRFLNISGQLDYRLRNDFKVWVASEYKQDKDRFYWGTPIVPANFPGIVPTSGIVKGMWTQYWPGPGFNGPVGTRNPATIDARTLTTTYNVLDNHSGAREFWLRSGFNWDITNNVTLKSQFYYFNAIRRWYNNEYNTFNDSPTPGLGAQGEVYRERLAIDEWQKMYGNITDLIVNSYIFGMQNRFVTTFAASTTSFDVAQDTAGPDDNSTSDTVSLINPARGFFGFRADEYIYSTYSNYSVAFEDRLRVTPTFALIGGIRFEEFIRKAVRFHPDGSLDVQRGYPVNVSFRPITGRAGYTWEALPGLMFYSQYATAADPAGFNSFRLDARVPFALTTTRTYETGVKHLFWDKRAEWTLSAYDIERRNVWIPESRRQYNLAGKIKTKGVEFAAAVNPFAGLKLWGNIAYVDSRFVDFSFVSNGVVQSYSGNTPPNVPFLVANAGGGYRFATAWPVEIGASGRYVGDRHNNPDNMIVMCGYFVADAYLFVDIPKWAFNTVNDTRLSFRVRNLTDKQYAAWGEAPYFDQVMLGAPRSFEVGASFKW